MRHFAALIILFLATTLAKADYVTVSLRPVANQLDNRIPEMPVGKVTIEGVPFDLLPMTGNNSWAAEVGTSVGVPSTQTMVLPVKIHGAAAVDTLINTSQGVPGSTTVRLSFVCTDGKTHSVVLKGSTDIRDWFQGDYVNTTTASTTIQVHDRVADTPSGRHGRIDKQTISLPPDFADRTLAYIILTDTGATGNGDVNYCKRIGAQRAFIYGVTVTTIGKTKADKENTEPGQFPPIPYVKGGGGTPSVGEHLPVLEDLDLFSKQGYHELLEIQKNGGGVAASAGVHLPVLEGADINSKQGYHELLEIQKNGGESLDRLSQEMTDEAISKLKGKEAKQMSDLLLKYKKDHIALSEQRAGLDEEMERDMLKVIVLPSPKPSEAVGLFRGSNLKKMKSLGVSAVFYECGNSKTSQPRRDFK